MAPSNLNFVNLFMFLLFSILIFLQCQPAYSSRQNRFIYQNPSSGLVSDGIDAFVLRRPKVFVTELESLKPNVSSESYCEQTYGFLPCTKTAIGNLFLLVVYGFFMFKSASLLTDGSEVLLDVLGPGIVGALFLPILGALPDTLLIVVSGISGSKETAQQQVVIGMGLLAGSTVMLATALWGACLVVGKCDLSSESVAIDSKDTKGFSLFGAGVTVDKSTRKASWIMMATILPFIIAQIPLIFNLKSGKHASVLVACIVALLSLLGYCLFQIFEPWVQKRRLSFLKHRHIISSILAEHQKRYGALVKDNGEPNEAAIHKVFERLDEDNDQYLSKGELHGLIVGLNIDQEIDVKESVDKIMFEFDVDPDNRLTRQEFTNGMSKWIRMATHTVGHSNDDSIATDFHKKSKEELEALLDNDEESSTVVENKWKVYMKACLLLLGGAVMAGVFADPLVDAVDNFSDATNIPSFFISFIAMPLATNSSEAISALIFASRKKKRTASLTYSEIYGAVTMNNTLCLGVFLAIVYIRGLDWNFSAEVLVILVVVIVTGIIGSIYTTLKLWMCAIAFLLYPLSLVMVYVLDYILGWT
uniref:TSA: Wollemia nobilis Ref_Wollemi_Transcript_13884_1970 transcribed RNA sequence n=1 Tax=Wollemia nobilis TaxID=56998 RepID=A0A0C9S785_9CONI